MDKGFKDPLYGNYRAKVVNNRDKELFGRVMVWIPDLMPEISDSIGIWARPANNPMGGRNKSIGNPPKKPRTTRGGSLAENWEYQEALDDYQEAASNFYQGSSFIPANGSWTWVFFEAGNINRPYYFGALDLENAKVLPENQLGSSFEAKWTLFKSHAGRAIVVSDDPDDERVEITGKKLLLTEPPSGDTFSVYRIDENQNTILLDERDDTEKLLIKTRKGDFIKLSIKDRTLEIQVADNVEIKSGGHILVTSSGDQHFLAGGNMYLTAGAGIHMVAGGSINQEAGDEYNYKCGSNSNEIIGAIHVSEIGAESFTKAATEHHTQAGTLIARDAASIQDNSGSSKPPPPAVVDAKPATSSDPIGDRDKS